MLKDLKIEAETNSEIEPGKEKTTGPTAEELLRVFKFLERHTKK